MTETDSGEIQIFPSNHSVMKTECKSLQDVDIWLQSVISHSSSLYSVQNIIDYFNMVLTTTFIDDRVLSILSNKIITILSSYPKEMDLSLVESSLLTLCDYLHTPWKQHALYMIDCLCSLFPAFFPICIPSCIKYDAFHFVVERLIHSPLCSDDCITCLIHALLHQLPVYQQSPQDAFFDRLDQVFILIESIESTETQSLFLPFIREVLKCLDSLQLLQSYFSDLPLTLPFSHWLLQSLLPNCEEASDFAFLLILFTKYQTVYSPSAGLWYKQPYPVPTSLIPSLLLKGQTLIQRKVLTNLDFFLDFLNSITETPPDCYHSVLKQILSSPQSLHSFKSSFIEKTIKEKIGWRLLFLSENLQLFVHPSDYTTLLSILDCYPVIPSSQNQFIHRCYAFLFASFTPDCLQHFPTSATLIRSFIPFFIQWSRQESETLFSNYQSFIQQIVDHHLIETSKALLHEEIQSHSFAHSIQQYYIRSIQKQLTSYYTRSGFDLNRCVSRNDYSISFNPFYFAATLDRMKHNPFPSYEWTQCAVNTDWLQEQSDHFRGDLFFLPKAFPSFVLLLCEMYYSLYLMAGFNEEYLIFAMELELCLDNRTELAPFFSSILQSKQLDCLLQNIDKPIVVSFLLTHLDLEELYTSPTLPSVCAIVLALFELDSFESPSLTMEILRPMKSAMKELAPRSIPSLKRKLSKTYLLNCFSLIVDTLLKKHFIEFKESIQCKSTFEDWLQRTVKKVATNNPSSSLLTSLSSFLPDAETPGFSLIEWKKAAPESDEYHMLLQGILNGSSILQLLDVFRIKAPAADCLLLIQSCLSCLPPVEQTLQSVITRLPVEVLSIYQEISLHYHQSFHPIKQVTIREFDALTIIASLFPLLLNSLKQNPNDSLFSTLFLCMEAMLSFVFEIRSTQIQWIINNAIQYAEFCKDERDGVLERLSLLPLIGNWCNEASIFEKYKRKITSALIAVRTFWNSKKKEEEVKTIVDHLPLKQKPVLKKKNQKRMYNRNPAVNAMLEEEEVGGDNYEDLADFIDPTPDTSLKNIHFTF